MVPIQSECQEWAGEHDLTEAELEFHFPSIWIWTQQNLFFFPQTIERPKSRQEEIFREDGWTDKSNRKWWWQRTHGSERSHWRIMPVVQYRIEPCLRGNRLEKCEEKIVEKKTFTFCDQCELRPEGDKVQRKSNSLFRSFLQCCATKSRHVSTLFIYFLNLQRGGVINNTSNHCFV